MNIEHKKMPLVLESYELEEVLIPWGPERKVTKVIRITLHGKNIIAGAYEPVVKIGDVVVQYPQIQQDEQGIIGYLTTMPDDGAPIILEYDGEEIGRLKEPFTRRKLQGMAVEVDVYD